MGEQAAIFLRVSTDHQDEANQEDVTTRHCDDSGYDVAKTYRLNDRSAYHGQHARELDEIIDDVQAGRYTVIVVAHSSRIDRRDVDTQERFALSVRLAGGRVESATEPMFGKLDDAGRILTLVSQIGNHKYSKDLSGHVNRAFRRMDDSGSFRGCPPAGYAVVGPKYARALVPDTGQEEAPGAHGERKRRRVLAADVEQAFKDAAAQTGTVALGKRLGMSTAAVTKMLRNTTYSTGLYQVKRSDGVTAIHRTDPLVSPGVQALAIAGLEARRTGDNVSSRSIQKLDYSGAVFCYCGSQVGMHRYSGGGKKRADGTLAPRVRRYHCGSCGKSVNAGNADQVVEQLMSGRTDWWLTSWVIEGSDHTAALDRVLMELRELPGRNLPDDEEDRERMRLRGERKRLEGLPSVPARVEHGFKTDANGRNMTEGERWTGLDHEARRDVLTGESIRIFVRSKPGRTGEVEAELVFTDAEAA